ncbi:PTS transporter subunit EIIC [Streptococcus mutans]|uniref:Permease IIC component n=1 Tax=Streptococcus mutans SM6 TaxID=857119 RepID=A0A829BI57_STRMG|nr:PTS transporter subunit EIIC [Streptococcus mutans]EMC23435.1 cellobiose phosphotransferase system IIC component [Streptococcus mutans SM6]
MDEQKGLFGFLDKYLMGPMSIIAQYKVVRAITAAGMAVVPFTIVGSMVLVFSVLPISFSFLPIVKDIFAASFDKFTALYMIINYATMGSLSLYFVLTMGYELTKIYAEEEELNMNPLNGALLSLFAFIMTVPQIVFNNGSMSSVTTLKKGAVTVDGWAMSNGVTRFGTTGIFTAIIMGILTVLLYRLCIKRNWVIKMPEAVPEGVSRGFSALIPSFVIAFVVIFIDGIFIFLGTDIFEAISIPFSFVRNLTGTWIGIMIIYLLTQALWIVGIHGANIIFAFVNPIALANMAENAKASVVPAIFNINEPLIFGIPIIYNPALAIPFILAPMTSATLYYLAMKLDLIKAVFANVPWPTPVGIGAFIGTGDWKSVILALICAVAAFLVYYPFIRNYDRKLVKEEREASAIA